MANYRVDVLWPWLSFEPPEGTSDFGTGTNVTGPMGIRMMAGAYDPADQAEMPTPVGNKVGLSNWRPADVNPFARYAMSPTTQRPDPQSSWFGPRDNDEPKWPWLRVAPPNGLSGFGVNSNGVAPTGIRMMAGAYDPAGQAAMPAPGANGVGLSNWRPAKAESFAQYVMQPALPEPEPQHSCLASRGNDEESRPS